MNVGILLAAGKGERFGAPKQFLPLGDMHVIEYSMRVFELHPKIDAFIVMVNEDHAHLRSLIKLKCNKLKGFYIGGKSRQESVRKGLEAVSELAPKNVLIHDVARPFVSERNISQLLSALDDYIAADLYVDVVDTIKVKESFETVDRDKLYITQTPQAFRYKEIIEAHARYKGYEYTDDITLARLSGYSIGLVKGDKRNFKITTQDDYEMAKNMVMEYEIRTGSGFDTHVLEDVDGGFITLGGEEIAADKKVVAHSDGDVILHALMDALLGSVGMGDIGEHFPPSDNKWKGASSLDMLGVVYTMMEGVGAHIVNIDITYLGEVPKILRYKEKMKNNIATVLKLDNNRINIKATTMEGMGFIGRVEGVAALASCSIKMKKKV